MSDRNTKKTSQLEEMAEILQLLANNEISTEDARRRLNRAEYENAFTLPETSTLHTNEAVSPASTEESSDDFELAAEQPVTFESDDFVQEADIAILEESEPESPSQDAYALEHSPAHLIDTESNLPTILEPQFGYQPAKLYSGKGVLVAVFVAIGLTLMLLGFIAFGILPDVFHLKSIGETAEAILLDRKQQESCMIFPNLLIS